MGCLVCRENSSSWFVHHTVSPCHSRVMLLARSLIHAYRAWPTRAPSLASPIVSMPQPGTLAPLEAPDLGQNGAPRPGAESTLILHKVQVISLLPRNHRTHTDSSDTPGGTSNTLYWIDFLLSVWTPKRMGLDIRATTLWEFLRNGRESVKGTLVSETRPPCPAPGSHTAYINVAVCKTRNCRSSKTVLFPSQPFHLT